MMQNTTAQGAYRLAQRTSLGVDRNRLDVLGERAESSWDDAVDWVMNQPAVTDRPPTQLPDDAEKTSWEAPVFWWVDLMSSGEGGLTDRMAWFWHTLLTTNTQKVSTVELVADQLHDFRTLGRTDFRTLLQAFVSGGALQEYLDGSHSLASNPNENLARELMELFTLGHAALPSGLGADESDGDRLATEDDVKSAARALAGWVVDDGKIEFRRENAFIAPLLFLGQQDRWDTTKVVDRLCDHPATAAHVSGRLWLHLVGAPLGADDQTELGRWWADHDLSIDPLIERILASPAFVDPSLGRARSGLEWFCAARSALGASSDDYWGLWSVEQMPYHPPNVAGWQDYSGTNTYGERWLSAGSLLGRSATVSSLLEQAGMFDNERYEDKTDDYISRFGITSEEILDRCGITVPSETTWAALDSVGEAEGSELQQHTISQARWRLALSSPEFNLL